MGYYPYGFLVIRKTLAGDFYFKRKVKEAIFIKVNNPSLNQNVGKFNLPPIYDQLLTGGGQDKLFIHSNVKDAIPKIRLKKNATDTQYEIVRD